MKSDIIKDSELLRNGLINRWKELGIKDRVIIQDAIMRGVGGINSVSISRWRRDPNMKGALNQDSILFLGIRWGIKIRLHIGDPYIEDGKLKHAIPPYNEEKALSELYKMFPHLIITNKKIDAKVRKKRTTKPKTEKKVIKKVVKKK